MIAPHAGRGAIVALAMAAVCAAGGQPSGPAIRAVTAPAAPVPQFGLMELAVDLDAGEARVYYPFGPDDGYTHPDGITVDAVVTEPSGAVRVVPAFYYTPYTLTDVDGQRDVLGIDGASGWRVRFTPRAAGAHRLAIRATDARGTTTSTPVTVTVTPSARRGFVRVSTRDSRLLEYDDGEPFIPIAEGRQWAPSDARRASSYADAFARDAAAGVNLTRIWDQNDSFNLSIEGADPVWTPKWSQFSAALGIALDGAHDGRRAARFRGQETRTDGYVQAVAVRPSTRYRLSGWIRTDGLSGDGAMLAAGPGDPANPGPQRTPPVRGSADWAQVQTEFTTGPGERWTAVWAGAVRSRGSAWFDDLSLVAVAGDQVNAISDPGFERHFPKADAGNDPEDPAVAAGVPKGTAINQWSAFQLDRILAAAEAQGIAVQLCSHADVYWTWDATVNDGDYARDNGYRAGWLDPRHLGYWQRSYRYRIARWGHSTALLAWEVWNEHGTIDVPSELQTFYQRLGSFVAATDPYRHPFTTSQGSQTYSPGFWASTPTDLVNYHDYITTENARHEPALAGDGAAFVYRLADGLVADWPAGTAPKPIIWGEIGTLKTWDVDDPRLSTGAAATLTRRQFLWAGLLGPALTSPIDWQTVAKAESTQALRAFLTGEPWTSAGWRPFATPDLEPRAATPLPAPAARVRVIALVDRGGTRLLGWVQHRDATWVNLVAGRKAQPIAGGFTTPDLAAGAYVVEWWNTRTGVIAASRRRDHRGGPMTLTWPTPLTDDVAVKVKRR